MLLDNERMSLSCAKLEVIMQNHEMNEQALEKVKIPKNKILFFSNLKIHGCHTQQGILESLDSYVTCGELLNLCASVSSPVNWGITQSF